MDLDTEMELEDFLEWIWSTKGRQLEKELKVIKIIREVFPLGIMSAGISLAVGGLRNGTSKNINKSRKKPSRIAG